MKRLLAAALALALSAGAAAQSKPANGKKAVFDSIQPCASLVTEMQPVIKKSQGLKDVLETPPDDVNGFLTDIFVGTQLMLTFGNDMFRVSEQFEESCKAELRERDKPLEIGRIYELVTPPILQGYHFLVRVRAAAEIVGDTATRKDMESAITDYVASMRKLVDLCKGDLGAEGAERCEALSRDIEARVSAIDAKPFP